MLANLSPPAIRPPGPSWNTFTVIWLMGKTKGQVRANVWPKRFSSSIGFVTLLCLCRYLTPSRLWDLKFQIPEGG